MLAVKHVAECFRVSEKAIEKLMQSGELPHVVIGGRRLTDQASIEAFLDTAKRPQQRPPDAFCYFYGSEDGSIGYVGQTINPHLRRRDHEHGRHPATMKLNALLAERGEIARFRFWKVDTTQQSLSDWEKHYADQFRANGCTLVNVVPLVAATCMSGQASSPHLTTPSRVSL
jgi:hypothetical protein